MKGPIKYILIFLLVTLAFVSGWALISSLLDGKPFLDGYKSVLDWVLGVFCGGSAAFSTWRKDCGDK